MPEHQDEPPEDEPAAYDGYNGGGLSFAEETPINLRTTLNAATAQVRELLNLWNTQTADMIVIGLKIWCASVLIANPSYLYSTLRLKDLSELLPTAWWFGAFAGLGIYMTVGIVFGSSNCPGGVPNPYMRTARQERGWQYMRMIGWFAGSCFNCLVVILLSKQGVWNFGVGLFGMKAICCMIAFSMPFRMRLTDDAKKHEKQRRIERALRDRARRLRESQSETPTQSRA